MTTSRHQDNNQSGKSSKRLKKYMKSKLSVSIVLLGLALLALLVHIYFIQKDNVVDYNKRVLSQRQAKYESRTLPYRRGDIYDRNGARLASSEKVYILILDPRQMNSTEYPIEGGAKAKNVVEPTIAALNEFFGYETDDLREKIKSNASSAYVRYQKDISYDDKQAFDEFVEKKNKEFASSDDPETKKNKIAGVWFEECYKRVYPYGSLACNVIGFTSEDGTVASGGVEQYYNSTLTGTNGREYGYLSDEANLEKVIKSAINGDSLVLTIDATVQNIVEKYLDEWKNGEIGSKSAACVVMNVKNGEVLGMASTKSFDLNHPYTTGDYTDEEIYAYGINEAVSDYKLKNPDKTPITSEQVTDYYSYDEIMELGKTIAMYQYWRNICISDAYEPGSTQKIFTVAGALEENAISKDASFDCTGNVRLTDGVNSWRINCVNRNGHGILDVTGGITNSCNVVMMNIAFAEKAETFMKYQKIFGFGGYTGIDLPAEANTENLGFSEENIGRTQLATNSFGQNYNCTMIQMAAAYCSVLNGGYYYKPHVVKQILSADGALKEDVEPLLVRETVSASTCDFIKNALVETVENGTGKAAKVEGYTVGGKTGTAQKLPRSAKTYVVSFCGYAPAEDPQILCYVIVDEPNLPGEEAAHSSFASEIFSKIMSEVLPAMNIYPESDTDSAELGTPEAVLPQNEGDNRTQMGAEISSSETEAGESDNSLDIITNVNGDSVTETIAADAATAPAEAATDEYIQGTDGSEDEPDAVLPEMLPENIEIGYAPQPDE